MTSNSPTEERQQWEYKVSDHKGQYDVNVLNRFGAAGWELVSVMHFKLNYYPNDQWVATFKRPKSTNPINTTP
jgi:hypothetical protein